MNEFRQQAIGEFRGLSELQRKLKAREEELREKIELAKQQNP